jgi:hypothetical protein
MKKKEMGGSCDTHGEIKMWERSFRFLPLEDIGIYKKIILKWNFGLD